MKGEYVEPKDDSNNLFAKFQQQQQQYQQQNYPQQPQHLLLQHQHQHLPHPHHHNQKCQTSEEDDNSHSTGGGAIVTTATADGGTIEVVRRPRGRPPGSKNKPKPPVIITRETDPGMSPYILEVPGGVDIVEAISRFSRRRNTGLCILTGSGTVANVTLRQPSTTPGATVTFHGRFDILSVSATFLPPSVLSQFPSINNITISLAGPQGQIVGGAVAGPLQAAGTVYVIAASFNNPSYHRLPTKDEEGHNNSVSGGTNDGHSPPTMSGDSGHPPAMETHAIAMYNTSHLPTDVIWAPTPRQPPPPPPY